MRNCLSLLLLCLAVVSTTDQEEDVIVAHESWEDGDSDSSDYTEQAVGESSSPQMEKFTLDDVIFHNAPAELLDEGGESEETKRGRELYTEAADAAMEEMVGKLATRWVFILIYYYSD